MGPTLLLGVAIVCVGCIEGRKEAADGGGVVDVPLVVSDALPDMGPPPDQGHALDGLVSCADNQICGATSYCARSMGCIGSGVCTARPAGCPILDTPVCGCDDMTYENECRANAAGVNVKDQGECTTASSTCYGPSQCTPDQFCDLDYDCNGLKGSGPCVARPTSCDETWTPVCACDSQTYANACEAHTAGQAVSYEGECEA